MTLGIFWFVGAVVVAVFMVAALIRPDKY